MPCVYKSIKAAVVLRMLFMMCPWFPSTASGDLVTIPQPGVGLAGQLNIIHEQLRV